MDGIIQQTIRRYLIPETEPCAIISIEQLQQELIKKIISLAREHYSCQIEIGKCSFVEELIGDNQE